MNNILCDKKTKQKCDSFYKQAFENRKEYIEILQGKNTQIKDQLQKSNEIISKLEQWLDLEWKRPAIKICISDVVYKINELKKETTNE